MTIDNKIKDESYNLTLKEKHYHQVKLINIHILQLKKYCLVIKDK